MLSPDHHSVAYSRFRGITTDTASSFTPAAAAISAAAFGLLHCYQGWLGTARTAVTGFLLALPLLMAGTILPAILAHVLVDLAGGLVIGPRLIRSPALVPAEEKE